MKVLISCASFAPAYGGPAYSVSRLAAELARLGASAGLWAPDGSALSSPIVPKGSGLVALDGSLASALIRFGKPDIFHDNGMWWRHNHAIASWARRNGVARLVSTRGMLEPWALKHKGFKKRIAWHLYQRRDLAIAKALHATSPVEAQNIAELGLKVPVKVIPNGIDIPEHPARSVAAAGPRRAMFLGRLHPVKGLPDLLMAWAKAHMAGWVLDIAGPDEDGHRQVLEAAVRKYQLTGRVEFLGPVLGDRKADLFRRSELFILPTKSENFGVSIAEALSYGLPVLTTMAAPWPLLEATRSGWRVEASADGLTMGLRSALSASPAELSEMGQRGKAAVTEQLAWEGIARAMGALYRDAVRAV